jgi:hypothetical protein
MFGQTGDYRVHILEAIDHNGPRRSAKNGGLGDAVNMKAVPVQPGRFVSRKVHVIVERFVSIDHRLDDFILMADGRKVSSVGVNIH